MKQEQIVPIGMLGKSSQFPFAGFFTGKARIQSGSFVVIGRLHDADLKRDFRQTVQRSKGLSTTLEACRDMTSFKEVFREIWEWYQQGKSHSQIVSLIMQVVTPTGDVWISTYGMSGLWGLSEDTWYSLLSQEHGVLQNKLVSDYPLCFKVSPAPTRILAIPQPFQNHFPPAVSLKSHVFEVNDVD